MLDYVNNMDPHFKPSYLQIKYPAENYEIHTETSLIQDTERQILMPMRDILDSGFTSVVGVGTPPQKLYCIFDTGSSLMFVK